MISTEASKTKLWFYPGELVVLVGALSAVILYHLLGIPLRSPLHLYLYRIRHAALFYTIGFFVAVAVFRLSDLQQGFRMKIYPRFAVTRAQIREKYVNRELFFRDLRILNCVCLMYVFYVNLKHLIPFVNSRLYDKLLADSELVLLNGKLAATWFKELLGVEYSVLLSTGYTVFYGYSAFLIFFFVLQRKDRQLTTEFNLAFVLLWLLAIPVIYLFPTHGPCFHYPELFLDLPPSNVTSMQSGLWRHKLFIDAHPTSKAGAFLISGLPSLHLAVPMLGAIYLWRVSRFLAWLSWLFVGITTITTLYFGWHYIWDDLAAVAHTLLTIGLARYLMQWKRWPT